MRQALEPWTNLKPSPRIRAAAALSDRHRNRRARSYTLRRNALDPVLASCCTLHTDTGAGPLPWAPCGDSDTAVSGSSKEPGAFEVGYKVLKSPSLKLPRSAHACSQSAHVSVRGTLLGPLPSRCHRSCCCRCCCCWLCVAVAWRNPAKRCAGGARELPSHRVTTIRSEPPCRVKRYDGTDGGSARLLRAFSSTHAREHTLRAVRAQPTCLPRFIYSQRRSPTLREGVRAPIHLHARSAA